MLIINKTKLPYECIGWIIDELGKTQTTIYYGKEDCAYVRVPKKYEYIYSDDKVHIKITMKYLKRYVKIIFSETK